jgi:ABC-type uncharacterized transport system permease subunit
MDLSKRLSVNVISILFLFAVCFCATSSFADMSFLVTDKDDQNKALIEIKENKAYVTVVEVKNGQWLSKQLAVNKYCQEKAGIVTKNIQGIYLKSDTKLCHCVTKDNFVVLIARHKDGRIEILRDSKGNYIVPIGENLQDINEKKIAGVQSVLAIETPDGRLSLSK